MPFFCRFLRQLAFDFADQVAVALGQRIQPLHHHRVGLGVEREERQVFEFLPHFLHAHAAGQRRIDVQRFLGDPAPGRGRHEFQRAHVVQPVGQLDQEDADVVGDRQQQLAEVLGLLGFARNELQPFQLGEAFDQRADLVPEHLVDFGAGSFGILDGVVQQRRNDGGIVELEVGEDCRHLERMGEVGVAGRPGLRAMGPHGVDVGAIQQILIGIRVVGPDALDQIILPHHARARRFRRLRAGHRYGRGRRHRD